MNSVEQRAFFQTFKAEVLTTNQDNLKLIREFVSIKNANGLGIYLAEHAWDDDIAGETRVYVIKDNTDSIALFFSLKCGLLVGDNFDEQLPADQSVFVDTVVTCMDNNDEAGKANMHELGEALFGELVDKLFDIADRKHIRGTEAGKIGQAENTINVANSIPAIELMHICKNDNYNAPKGIAIQLGFGLFWELIVPIIVDISKTIGCKYVYLFAADKTKRLISHYKNNFKFYECDKLTKFIKPDYDEYCYGLVQPISALAKNHEDVWQAFSDVNSL